MMITIQFRTVYIFITLVVVACMKLAMADASVLGEYEKKLAQKEYPTKTLYNLWKSSLHDQTAITNFLSTLPESHIIEPIENDAAHVLVTYFALGDSETDYIMQSGGPDFYGLRFKKLGQTNLYFCTQKIPIDAMFIYGFNKFTLSEKNTNGEVAETSMQHIYDGAVVAPKAKLSPYISVMPNVFKGELNTVEIPSKYMNESRTVSVYLPANQDKETVYNLVILFDGQNYSSAPNRGEIWQGWAPTPTILDNLIAKQIISPTIAIMIWNQGSRSNDLKSDHMTDFVALELLSWARKNYNINKDASKIIVVGSSRGGFAAANTAYRYPNRIGGVLSQSGSFWITAKDKENWPIYPEKDGKMIIKYKLSPRLPIKFYLSAGLYDIGIGIVGANRQMRDILELKGYEVEYREFKGGHSYVNWRHDLAEGLISLLSETKTNKALQRTSR